MNPADIQFSQRLPMLVFIAWRNLWRNRIRSILTILAMAGGLTLMILYATMVEGMSRQMVDFATNTSTGHLQVHRKAFIDDQDIYAILPWSALQHLEQQFPDIHLAPRLYAAGLAGAGDMSQGVFIKAIDIAREQQTTNILQHVRHGQADLQLARLDLENELDIHNVVIGTQLARSLRVNPGDELVILSQAIDGSIGNALFRVSGILKPIDPAFDRTGVLMSIKAFQSLMYLEKGFHELTVSVDNIELLDDYQQRIETSLTQWIAGTTLHEKDAQGIVRTWRQLVPLVASMLDISKVAIYIVGGIMIGLASLGMVNTMLMAIHERTHEFGILLCIGMGRYWLLLMVLCESFFLSLISAIFGGVLGVSLSLYLVHHGIDMSPMLPDGVDFGGIIWEPVWKGYLLPGSVISGMFLMMTISMLAALLPSWQTVRLKPAQVL